MRSRRWLVFNVVLVSGLCALAVWAVGKIDWRMVGRNLTMVSPLTVLEMAAAWIGALFVRPVRLMVLIHAMAPELGRRYWPVWAADLIAMAVNTVIPVRAGDLAMAFVLRQGIGLRTARGFSAVFVDRFFDLVTVIVLFVSALAVAPRVTPWASNLAITLPIGLVALAGGVWLLVSTHGFWRRAFDRLLARLPPERAKRWSAQMHDLFDGLVLLNRPGVMIVSLVLSVLLWGLTATSYWLGVHAVWPQTPLAGGALAAGAVALSFALPATPGGIGIFHAVTVVALSLFDVPVEAALAAAIICHALQLVTVMILATVALVRQGLSVRSLTSLRSDP